jgi:hypothetical protein
LTPHPLAVRFKAATPVYPMRLTAVGNRDLSLDLYVFADRRAEVEGMDVVRSGPVVRGDPDAGERYRWWADGREGEVVIGHRSLRALTGTASTVTKLSGVFTPRQMGRDLTIGWAEPRTIGAHKYSGHGASIVALNITGAAWLAAVIGVFVVGAVKKTPNRRLAGVGWAALAPCLLLGLVVRAALPTTDVVDDGRRPYRGRSVELITDALEADAKAGHSWSSADEFRIGLRGEMESVRARERRYARVELPRHQDSPGNYVVREGEGGSAEVVYFDGIGREEVVWRTGKLGR